MARKNNNLDDEPKDALEEMDAQDEEEEEGEDGEIDPEKMKKNGMHIETEDDAPTEIGEDFKERDPFLSAELPEEEDTEEEEEEVELGDEEFEDGPEW